VATTISTTSSSTGSISSPGIGSGLDVSSIVSSLIAADRAGPTQIINTKQAAAQAKLSAIGTLTSAINSFQTAVTALNDPTSYTSMTATASNTSVLAASATSLATAGTYNVTVNQLAQAQSLATAGQSSTTAAIGSGAATTITFEFGSVSGGTFTQDASQPSGSLTIDSSNNSITGIRDAINNANLGVTASIVNDGSASGYHLVLTSNKTGATSNMKITASGDASISSLLSYDPTAAAGTQALTQTVAGQDASLSINGMSITSASNTVDSAISGLSLTLDTTGSSTVSISQNTVGVQTNLAAFVSAYNSLNSTIHSVQAVGTASDGTTDTTQSGALIGDLSVQMLQFQLGNMMSSTLTNASGGKALLSDIGISVDKDGVMSLDSTKLQSALSKNPDDVAAMFSSYGSTTDSLVTYVGSNSVTPVGTNDINITQLATHGSVTAAGAIAASTTITTGSNDGLSVNVDGITGSITLAAGTYTPAQMAAQLQAAINGASAFSSKGVAVSVSVDASGKLVVTSNSYGANSFLSLSGSAMTDVFGGSASGSAGLDVAGTIGGVAASGSGQTLTGALGTPVAGLKVQITGGSTGNRGTVSYTTGFASTLTNLLNNYIGTNGVFPGETTSLNSSLTDLSNQLTELNNRLDAEQAVYLAQYTALDTTISQMNSTQSYLTQAIAQINANSSSSSSSK
jgi:flagellar hook-associated protein 2